MTLSKQGIDLSICAYCGTLLNDENRTVDHLNPESRGGKRSNKNKRPSCRKCNEIKGDMNLAEFSRFVDALLRMNQKERSYLVKLSYNTKRIIKEVQR